LSSANRGLNYAQHLRWHKGLSLHRPRPLVPGPRGSDMRSASSFADIADGRLRDAETLSDQLIGWRCSPDRQDIPSGELGRAVELADVRTAVVTDSARLLLSDHKRHRRATTFAASGHGASPITCIHSSIDFGCVSKNSSMLKVGSNCSGCRLASLRLCLAR
jgi:hypothetical protein